MTHPLHPLSEALLRDILSLVEVEGPPFISVSITVHDVAIRDRLAAIEAAIRSDSDARIAALEGVLRDCAMAAHNGGIAMDQKQRGGREKLAYIERRAAAALAGAAASEEETWGRHRFKPGHVNPTSCIWTDGKWSACKALPHSACHIQEPLVPIANLDHSPTAHPFTTDSAE